MDLENKIIKSYSNYIKDKSIFGNTLQVYPEPLQSFSTFPTIIIKEVSNTQSTFNTSTNRYEYADNVTYQVDIYSKAITLGNKKYQARNVVNELVLLTCNFFMDCGFVRTSGNKNDYIDISINRYTMIFTATRNNWNGKIR